MKNRLIKAGTCVPKMKVGNVDYNVGEIERLMRSHADCGLLVFPELCITGYTCADLFFQKSLLEDARRGLKRLAEATKELKGMTAVVGIPVQYANTLYNCAAYLSEGRVAGLVPKTNIPNYAEFYEGRWFDSGRDLLSTTWTLDARTEVPMGTDLLFEDKRTRAVVGTDICEDLWIPDKPSTHACMAGANVIANPSASDDVIGKQDYRRSMVLQQSSSCYCAYLYTSAGTDESSTDLVYGGHSIIAVDGKLLREEIFPKESFVQTALIDLDEIDANRIRQNTYINREEDTHQRIPVSIGPVGGSLEVRAEEYARLLDREGAPAMRYPFVPADDAERGRRCRKILQIQANGLATRVRHSGIRTLVIGVSGGLDSTLALLAVHEAKKIVPDIRVIGVTMPSEGNTTESTYQDALELMKALHVEIRTIPIRKYVEEHLDLIGHGKQYRGEGDVTYENAQARMRTYLLMDIANMEGGIVVGTGDMSELALGWCTYNGDHMSMYAVNTSVPKTLVRYICRSYIQVTTSRRLKAVLQKITDTPISPELTPSDHGKIAQKTEDKIGRYDLNDFILFYTLRYGYDPEKIFALARHAYPEIRRTVLKETELRFYRRFFRMQFKRSCLPDGPKVGSVSLSPRGDWRMPSDADPESWIQALERV